MGMRAQVDRHAVHADREIRAVVQIETSEKVLIGFTAAGMLRDHDAWNHFQELSAAKKRAGNEFDVANTPFRSGTNPSTWVLTTVRRISE